MDSPYVFPADASFKKEPHETGCQWARSDLSEKLKKLLQQEGYGERLNIDLDRVKKLHGATTIHVVRLLFGSYWAGKKGRLVDTSNRLQHSSVELTADKYCGTSPRHASMEAQSLSPAADGDQENSSATRTARGEGGEAAGPEAGNGKDPMIAEIERLREERARLQEENERLREQAAEADGRMDRMEERLARLEGEE